MGRLADCRRMHRKNSDVYLSTPSHVCVLLLSRLCKTCSKTDLNSRIWGLLCCEQTLISFVVGGNGMANLTAVLLQGFGGGGQYLPPVYEFKLKVRRILNLNLCFRERRRKSKLNIPPLLLLMKSSPPPVILYRRRIFIPPPTWFSFFHGHPLPIAQKTRGRNEVWAGFFLIGTSPPL